MTSDFIKKSSGGNNKFNCFRARYGVAFVAALLNTVFYMTRAMLSVAIVAIALEDNGNAPFYPWNSNERSAVQSSFFWGYTAMQLPALAAVRYFGPRKITLIMTLTSAILTVVFVPAASLGWEAACASRALLGVSQAGLMATGHQLLSLWATPQERGRMVVYVYGGQQLGTIIALATSGIISDTIGWPWIFYISAILGLVLFIFVIILIYDTPEKHPWISQNERLKLQTCNSEEESLKSKTKLKIPWTSILTSIPYWTLLITHVCQCWGFWTLLNGIPSYMDGVLGYDLSANGLLSALPYFCMWIMSLIFAWLSDKIIKKKILGITVIRKCANVIGLGGPALALILISFLSINSTMAVTILTIGVGLNSGTILGLTANYIDLSQKFASALMGMSNQICCLAALAAPLVTGVIVVDNDSQSQWQTVFLISSGIYIVGIILFLLFGSGKEQPWNNPNTTNKV